MKKQTKLFTTLSAAALLTIGVSAVSMAAGWDNSTGVWRYLNNDGTEVTDTWKSANGNWFYLGSDGVMATNQLIEDNNNSKTRYYYVDQYGAMVKNTWKAVAMDSNADDIDAEYWWYYFGSDGKAYTTEDNLTVSKLKTIDGKKYAFDSEGHMLYGWLNKDNVSQQDGDDEAWKESTFFANGWNDGHIQTGWIQLTVEDNNETKEYWFNFKNDGTKRTGVKKINGTRYHFADDGHMITDWAVSSASVEDSTSATAGEVTYLNGDGAERKNKWVWAVPDEHSDKLAYGDKLKEDYDNDEYSWWYFNKNGKIVTSQIKKINGKKYAFDYYGRMLKGFVAAVDEENVVDRGNPDDWKRSQIIAGSHPKKGSIQGMDFYFFSNDEEKDGSMKKGYQTLELDDTTAQFYFNTSNGKAENGYVSKIKKYCINGLVLAPTADDDSNYGAVVLSGEEPTDFVTGSATLDNVLVNRSGTKVTKKTKLKDENDAYYVVGENGHVLAYFSSEDAYNKAFTYEVTEDGKKKEKKASVMSAYLEAETPDEFFDKVTDSTDGVPALANNATLKKACGKTTA